MNTESWGDLRELVKKFRVKVRLTLRSQSTATSWSSWLIEPAPSYLEVSGYGPARKEDVTRIEVDPIELKTVGRLMPDTQVNHSDDVMAYLTNAKLRYTKTNDGIFRIEV